MTVLNREAFQKTIPLLGVSVPAKQSGVLMKKLNGFLFDVPRLRTVVSDPQSKDKRLLLLRLDLTDKESLPEEAKQIIDSANADIISHEIRLGYDYWSAEQILHAIMPEGTQEIPTSFTQVGHIAHMNLRESFYPWKGLIGQVILDKNKSITCVVNKTNNIDTTFRFFQMEVLAGDGNMIAEVKESNCRFKFDFSKVYWNSRLHTEHDRLVQLFKPTDYIGDVFAGVGPFAVPAAKKGCTVYANDLNPISYQWLNENKKGNKIPETKLTTFNLDGRTFIRQAIKDLQAATADKSDGWRTFDHFVMNLPATAIEFLDAFRGVYRDQQDQYKATPSASLPMIHCHCFTKSEDPKTDITDRIRQAIGMPFDTTHSKLHWVRNVAPKKDMYCISFPLTPEIAFANSEKRKRDSIDDSSTPSKHPVT